MATQLQLRRGTTAQHSAFTGLEGELTYDTTLKHPVIHDGVTVGGFEVQTNRSFVGSVLMYGGALAPIGWLFCDGSAINRTTYVDLFTAITTTFGVGDGSTTFNLPDCRGIFVRGSGTHGTLTDANSTAFSGILGVESNDRFQSHNHLVRSNADPNQTQVTGGYLKGYQFQGGAHSAAGNANWPPMTDGSNGTPRTGAETNPANISLHYIIKF